MNRPPGPNPELLSEFSEFSVLTYGIKIEHLIVFPLNHILSDHYLITFEFLLVDYTPLDRNVFTRCLSDSAVDKFKETPSVLNSLPCLNTSEDSYVDLSSSQTDNLVDRAAGSLRITLDSINHLKRKIIIIIII